MYMFLLTISLFVVNTLSITDSDSYCELPLTFTDSSCDIYHTFIFNENNKLDRRKDTT